MLLPACMLLLAFLPNGRADAQESALPFPPDSPEHGALVAASPYLGSDKFHLRQDYWRGELGRNQGKAIRLQFFKGNTYRFFFSVSPKLIDKNARLVLEIYDPASKLVAEVEAVPGDSIAALHFKPGKTDLYLVLMRVEPAGDEPLRQDFPAVLFYGFE